MIFHPQKEAQLSLAVLLTLNTKFQFQSIECKDYKQAKKKLKKNAMSHLLRVLQKNKSLNPVHDRTQTIPPPQLSMFNVTQSQAWEGSPVPVPWG